jgi:hypothetical protein
MNIGWDRTGWTRRGRIGKGRGRKSIDQNGRGIEEDEENRG